MPHAYFPSTAPLARISGRQVSMHSAVPVRTLKGLGGSQVLRSRRPGGYTWWRASPAARQRQVLLPGTSFLEMKIHQATSQHRLGLPMAVVKNPWCMTCGGKEGKAARAVRCDACCVHASHRRARMECRLMQNSVTCAWHRPAGKPTACAMPDCRQPCLQAVAHQGGP